MAMVDYLFVLVALTAANAVVHPKFESHRLNHHKADAAHPVRATFTEVHSSSAQHTKVDTAADSEEGSSESLKSQLASLQKELQETRNKDSEKMDTLSQQLAEAQQNADKAVATMKTKLQKAEMAAQALNRQLKNLQKQKQQTEEDVQRAESNATHLAAHLKSFQADSATQIQKQETRMKKLLLEKSRDLEDAQDELQKSQIDAKEATDKKNELLEKVKKLTDKLAIAEVKKNQRQTFEVNIGKQLTLARSTQYDLKAEVSREKKELAKERDENAALEQKEAKMQRQMSMKVQDLEDENAGAEQKANKTIEEQKALRAADDKQARDKISDLKRQLQYMHKTSDEHASEAKKKVESIEDALGKERRRTKALEAEEEKMKTTIAKQKRQFQQSTEELEEDKSQQQALEKNRTELSNKLGDVESELQLIKQRSSASQRKLNAKIQELTHARDELSHESKLLQQNATSTKAQIQKLEESNEKMKRSLVAGAHKMQDLDEESRDAQQKANQTISMERSKHAEEEKQLESRIDLMKDQLHRVVSKAKIQETEADKKIEAITNQETHINASLATAKKELAEQNKLAAKRKSLLQEEDGEIDKANDEIASFKKKQAALADEKSALSTKISLLESKISREQAQSSNQIQELNDKVRELLAQSKSLGGYLKKAEVNASHISHDLSETMRENHGLKSRLMDKVHQIADIQDEMKKLQENSTHKLQIEQEARMRSTLLAKGEIQQLKSKLHDELANATAEQAAAQKKIEHLRWQNEKLNKTLTQEMSELSVTKKVAN